MSEEKKVAFIVRKDPDRESLLKKGQERLEQRIEERREERREEKKIAPTYEKEHKLEKIGLVVTVINDGQASAIVNMLNGVNSAVSFITHGEGTAKNDFYDVFGVGEQKKQVIFSTLKKNDWETYAKLLNERFSVSQAAKGISFMLNIDAVSGVSTYKFLTDRRIEPKETKGVTLMNKCDYEVIFAIVNHGYTDLVMNAAKRVGARGGTILSARGTGNKDIEKFYGVVISPEKQIVMILVKKDIRDAVLNAITAEANIHSKGQGIAFSVPADGVVGLMEEEENNAQ